MGLTQMRLKITSGCSSFSGRLRLPAVVALAGSSLLVNQNRQMAWAKPMGRLAAADLVPSPCASAVSHNRNGLAASTVS